MNCFVVTPGFGAYRKIATGVSMCNVARSIPSNVNPIRRVRGVPPKASDAPVEPPVPSASNASRTNEEPGKVGSPSVLEN